GTCWYVYSTETGVAEALMVCVVPFIPGDVLKIVLATILVRRLNPVLQKYLK
ncbi:MAG: biotin transporter BioY, partial [Lachnospiraceae bacterium]|nr:biotin transporter BioY [Lachnospiraceae bacterium]